MHLIIYKFLIIFLSFILLSLSVTNSEKIVKKDIEKNNFISINLWQQIFGGDLSDVGFRIIENNNNEFLTIGWTKSYGSGNDDVG